MKIEKQDNNIEKKGDFSESFFSIEDKGFVFEILRNKLYSNKIGSICREIASNSRDAHREAGIPNVPIEISLPSVADPVIKFRDYGPGITPDRMENIFIKYASSTKRDDNSQTGGFGLGAKTPFAYTDTFTIRSITDGTCRTYVAYIDETKIGKLSLMSECSSTEKQGTEIIVPVKDVDIKNFIKEVEYTTEFWDVKPNIVNGNITYEKFVPFFKNDTCALFRKQVPDPSRYSYQNLTMAVEAETFWGALMSSSLNTKLAYLCFGLAKLSCLIFAVMIKFAFEHAHISLGVYALFVFMAIFFGIKQGLIEAKE